MKLSEKTLAILNNFSKHNNSILFYPGKELKGLSKEKTIYLTATLDEEIPNKFALSELKEFLQVINLLKNADLDFLEDRIVISNNTNSVVFRHALTGVVNDIYQEKITLKEPAFEVSLPLEQVKNIVKMSRALQVQDIKVVSGDPGLLTLCDVKGSHSHSFTVNADKAIDAPLFSFNISSADFLEMDYTISYHPERKFVRWSGVQVDVKYHFPVSNLKA